MKHTAPLELRSALPLETRDEGDDPIAAATAAVEELRTGFESFRSQTDERLNEVRSLTERLEAIETRAARPGQGTAATDEERETRALATFARTGDLAELRAASTDHDPSGGYLVMPTLESGIRTIVRDVSPMRGLANVVTIGTDAYEVILDQDEAGAQWVTERGVRPQDTDRPELIKIRIPVGELYAAPKTTRQFVDDAQVDVAGWLLGSVGTKFAIAEGEAFVEGTGADQRPRGLLDYDAESADDFSRSKWQAWQYVPAGATSPTDKQLADALISVMMKLRVPYRAGARWLMSRDTARRIRQLKDGNDRYLWTNAGNMVEGTPDALLGFPVSYDDTMPAIGSGNLPVAFGDFRQGYTIVDRHGIRIARDELTAKGFVIFDSYRRVGGGGVDFNALKFLKISAS